jgi:hypothetical protein
MDNEAFEDSCNGNHDELIRILGMVEAGLENHGDGGKLRDINGNFVGDWEIAGMDDYMDDYMDDDMD